MARQDVNEALLQTSFLDGANAAYIEDLYARYAKDPKSVDAEWQAFFGALKDDSAIVAKNAQGASWKRENWPIAANGELVSALDGNWGQIEKTVAEKLKGKAEAKGVALTEEHACAAGHARFAACADDDPRLPHARPPACQSGSAGFREARQ